jgi:hypothetical protein
VTDHLTGRTSELEVIEVEFGVPVPRATRDPRAFGRAVREGTLFGSVPSAPEEMSVNTRGPGLDNREEVKRRRFVDGQSGEFSLRAYQTRSAE